MFTARPFVSPEAQRLLELLKTLFGSTFRQILWRNAAELELTYAQAQVLFYVAQHPGCHMGQVAKTFNVTLSATTQIVDRLVQKRFLTRSSKPADRRVYILELTPEGQALVRELEVLQVEVLEPESLREAVAAQLRLALERYEAGPRGDSKPASRKRR